MGQEGVEARQRLDFPGWMFLVFGGFLFDPSSEPLTVSLPRRGLDPRDFHKER